jgi:Mn-dependent DtxR family transcriptional regulator
MEAGMPLSETAREILEFFRETHRKPGARITMATLDAHFGTDPAVAVAISELKQLGYVTVPDGGTVELTDLGFDAIHRGVA